ncbi:MAG: hypothetical protein ACRETY_10860 [Steroidobacteraceae bacterium]
MLCLAGCNGKPGESSDTQAAADRQAAAANAPATALLSREDVASCAGFTVDSAAAILGVPSSALAAKTGWSDEMGGQMCRYWSPESFIGPGLQILLQVEESEAAADRYLDSLRENAPPGAAAIGSTMGQQSSSEAALIELEGAGDEAVWDALTGAATLRVANVVAVIEAAPSGDLAKGQDRAEIEFERKVAMEIARGLAAP